jgi:hypothetical protein
MAGINFDIRGDNSDYIRKMKEAQEMTRATSKTIQELGKNFDMSSAQKQIASLNIVIRDTQAAANGIREKMEQLQAAANRALTTGNVSTYEQQTKALNQQAKVLESLTADLNEYKAALSTIEGVTGATSSQPAVQQNLLFANEEDFNKAEELRQKITELKSEIASLNETDASVPALRKGLSDAEASLEKLEGEAAKAATALGAGFGSRAAEASANVYKLNAAVKEQQTTVTTLQGRVQMAAQALQALRSAETQDAGAIEQAQAQYDALKASLANATAELNNLQAEQVDVANEWGMMQGAISGMKLESYRTQMRAMRQELVQLTIEYRNMSDAERASAEGRALAAKMQELSEKAGALQDIVADVQKQIGNVASDTRMFDSFTQGFQLIVSGAGAATGAMSMLGVSEEDIRATQTALQASLATSNFLTKAQNALQKESALMMGIAQIQTAAAAKAISVKAAAEGKGVVATTAATVAQKIFNAVANANPYVLLATAIITVVGALTAFAMASKESKKRQEEEKKATEAAKQAKEDYANAVAESAGKAIANYDELRRKWSQLSSDMEKTQFIKKNTDAFQELGYQVDNINDADTLLVKNVAAVKKACLEKAKAAAAAALIIKKYEEILKNSLEKTTAKYTPVKEGDVNYKEMYVDMSGNLQYRRYTGEGAADENARRIKAANDAAKAANDAIDRKNQALYDDIDKLVKQKNESEKAVDEANQGLKTYTKPSSSSASKAAAKSTKDTAEERRKAQEKANEELLALQRKNEQEQIAMMKDGAEKKIAQIKFDYQQQRDEIFKQAKQLSEQNKAAGITGGFSVEKDGAEITNITEQQFNSLAEASAIAKKQMQDDIDAVYAEEADAMQSYLKQYGTYQEQKLAIAEEYSKKIADATTEGERLNLERQRDEELQSVNAKAMTQQIDWAQVFGAFGSMLKPELDAQIALLRQYMQSGEYNSMSAEDKQTIAEQYQAMVEQSGGMAVNFEQLGQALQNAEAALRAYQSTQQRHQLAIEALNAAEHDYLTAMRDGTDEERAAAKAKVESAQKEVIAAETSLQTAQDNAKQYSESAQFILQQQKASIQGITDGLSKLKSGSLSQAYEGLKELFNNDTLKSILGKSAANMMSKVSSALGGVAGGLAGAVLGLLDILKDGIGNLIGSLIDTVLNAVNGILQDVFKGKLVTGIAGSLISGVSSILNTVTFGGFNSWFSASGNAKAVNELTEELTESNDQLRSAIEKLTDEISSSSAFNALDIANEAYDMQQQVIDQQRKILENQMNYNAAHHSNAYYWGLGSDDYASINQTLKDYAERYGKDLKQVFSLTDILSLTPEEMDYIRNHNIEMWNKMLEQGKYDKSEYWEAFADLANQMDEITDALNEALTGVSFDSLKDSFESALLDMDSSASDMADNMKEYLMKAVLSAKIDELLSDQLQAFYDKWASLSEGGLTQSEINELQEIWNGLADQGLAIRNEVAAITGYDKASQSQSGSSGSYETISEDTAEELNGRFTALQIAGESAASSLAIIAEQSASTIAIIEGLAGNAAQATTILSDILAQHAISNAYLSSLETIQKKVYNTLEDDITSTLKEIKKAL